MLGLAPSRSVLTNHNWLNNVLATYHHAENKAITMLFSSALCLVVWQLAIPQMAHATHVTNLQHILLVMNHCDESIERRICLRYASSLTQKNSCSHLPNATLGEQISTRDMYLTLEQQLLSSMIHHCLRPLKDTTPDSASERL